MPFDKFEDVGDIDKGRRNAITKSIRIISIEELKKRGHTVEIGPGWSEGRLTAASREGRHRRAAANPRGMQGYAAGR